MSQNELRGSPVAQPDHLRARRVGPQRAGGAARRLDHTDGVRLRPGGGRSILRFRTAVTDAEGRLHVSFLDGAQRVSAVEERIEGRVPTTRSLYDPAAPLHDAIDA